MVEGIEDGHGFGVIVFVWRSFSVGLEGGGDGGYDAEDLDLETGR